MRIQHQHSSEKPVNIAFFFLSGKDSRRHAVMISLDFYVINYTFGDVKIDFLSFTVLQCLKQIVYSFLCMLINKVNFKVKTVVKVPALRLRVCIY